MFRSIYVICISFVCAGFAAVAYGQSAQIQGRVYDSTGAVISKAAIRVMDQRTNTARKTRTNNAGEYVVAGLNPSVYKIFVDATGFSSAVSTSITLNVNQNALLDFQLHVGSSSETITVDGSSTTINTTDAAVGTVIDRQFVSDMPLNGRSFQSLILLSPGTVTTTPQQTYASGQFSVNGQPANSNAYQLDGASASNTNFMSSNSSFGGAGVAGMIGNSTALGTTQALTSVDALQEFKIATSTYSAEFGRQPGAQISFQSRSGTNEYHGVVYDYLRNSAFDANNWFNDYVSPALPKPQERQNDFGGVLGGPLGIPGLFSGRNRAFFFITYEGLRLTQPGAAAVGYVPSNGTYNTAAYVNPLYKNLRANAPAALQPVMKSYPLPNCSIAQDAQCVDYGDGMSPALIAPATTGGIDSISGRFDFPISSSTRIFARYSGTDSHQTTDPESNVTYVGNVNLVRYRTRTYLLGVNSIFGASLTNELRLQYSSSFYHQLNVPTSFGGAQPADFLALQGLPQGNAVAMYLAFPHGTTSSYTLTGGTQQFQPNLVDTITWQHGTHLFKAGVDYIQTTAYMADPSWAAKNTIRYYFDNADQVLSNTLQSTTAIITSRQDPAFKNLGIFFQDEWRLHPRLSLSLGLRWELSPSPAVSGAVPYTYDGDLSNPASVSLAPLGTPLYGTVYKNFAPRFGIAAVLHNDPGHELILRAGEGCFMVRGIRS